MWPDWVSNPGPLTYESGALPTGLRSLAQYIKKKNIHPKLSSICSYGIFSKGLKNEYETAVVNEPSVFEPLKFYCISSQQD